MNLIRMQKPAFFLTTAISILLLSACSREPEPTANNTLEEPAQQQAQAATTAPAQIPEVVVLYGQKELVPWLEAENWWGEIDPEQPLTVPHIIITAIHPSWSEFSATLPVPVKKQLFFRLMLPLVMHANHMATTFREGLLQAKKEYEADGSLSAESLALIQRLAPLLPGMDIESAQALQADHDKMEEFLDALLYRMDTVPAGLALGQAAYESGYGTSRFATQGNSLFGQWTYKGEGIKPREQRTASKGDYQIKAFEWPFDSVRGYFINLMTHPAYEDFRKLRAEMRAAGEPFDSMKLADGLLRYSERGAEYVESLKGIMRVNKLYVADKAVFRDEPLRFLLSEQSPEDVEKTRQRLAEAEASGELAVILERMRLE
ncbi:glucosaminidase domain-containing protein [Haliea sp. E17]|uniref:glucosaminidase domain-containing protein n=1 Tax=Haliea sp. E17 TaxID=3401576 RepID=UPI003AB0A37C